MILRKSPFKKIISNTGYKWQLELLGNNEFTNTVKILKNRKAMTLLLQILLSE